MGVLRLEESIGPLAVNNESYANLLEETINTQLSVFKKLYLKDREIEHIIVVDDYVSMMMQKYEKEGRNTAHLAYDTFNRYVEEARKNGRFETSRKFGISEENAERLFISAMIIK